MNDRPRGLGRGLSALLGEPISTALAPNPPSALAPSPQPVAPPPLTPFEAPPMPSAFAPIPVAPAPVDNVTPFPIAPPSFDMTPPASETPAPVETPEPTVNAAPPSESVQQAARFLPIDLIQRNPNQPRKHFDETELSELADSIRSRGVLQPILVRPIGQDRFEIVAGERRWRAAQRAGLHHIPAVVQDLNEVEVLEIGIIENVQRADLNPLEEAQGYQALIDRFGRTQQDIAEIVGKSRPHIANMLRLLGLPQEIQSMVRDGQLTAGHARAILSAPNPVDLARMAIAQALNVREVEKLAQKAKDDAHGPRVRVGGAAEKDADTRALEESLSAALGLTVSIETKGEGGAVKISYRTLEQLDEIAKRLSGG
jgi:ParB family chromosome partitioning protein